MSYPTQAIIPIMLDDFRKVSEAKGEKKRFTEEMINNCMKGVTGVKLHETYKVNGIEIKGFYAGHVLGALMFAVSWNGLRIVYSGDYNMISDRHLASAYIDKIRPHLLFTETTYSTYIRDSKRVREREFLKQVHTTLERGGKVLIPVFALGRAQVLFYFIIKLKGTLHSA
jgi:integrator complex subunit 11